MIASLLLQFLLLQVMAAAVTLVVLRLMHMGTLDEPARGRRRSRPRL